VKQFEARERERGVLSEEEIGKESSKMIGKLMERKWKREGEKEVVMAGGMVRRLPGSGNVNKVDTGIWRWMGNDEFYDLVALHGER